MFKRTEVALFFVQREELWFGLYKYVRVVLDIDEGCKTGEMGCRCDRWRLGCTKDQL